MARQVGGGAGRQSSVQRRIARDEQVGQVAVDRAPVLLSAQRLTASFSLLPAENRGALVAAMYIRSPVDGLTP